MDGLLLKKWKETIVYLFMCIVHTAHECVRLITGAKKNMENKKWLIYLLICGRQWTLNRKNKNKNKYDYV